MKKITLFLCIALFSMSQAFAQTNPDFGKLFDEAPILDGDRDFLKISTKSVLPIIFKAKPDKSKVHELPQPFTVGYNGSCYAITCKNSKDCRCSLLWWDRNGDGQMQIRKEVRCQCKGTKKQCRIVGKRVTCTDGKDSKKPSKSNRKKPRKSRN